MSSPAPTGHGSTVPARLRITAWIVLTTAIGLGAVVLTMRSAEITDAERAANRDVAQELEEFRAFAAEAVDPATGGAFTSARALLEQHLTREYPSVDEVLVGYVEDGEDGEDALVLTDAEDPVGITSDPGLVRDLVTGQRTSGIARAADGEQYRWALARVQPSGPDGVAVDGPPAALLVAVTTETERAAVGEQVRLAVLVSLGCLVLTAAIALVVAGKILEPVRVVSRTASRISRGTLDERIPISGRDDLAALSASINAMLDRLQHAREAHRQSAVAAERHIRPALDRLATGAAPAARAELARIDGILADLALLAESESADLDGAGPVDLETLAEDLLTAVRAATGRDWTLDRSPLAGTGGLGSAALDADLVREATLRLAENATAADPDGSLRLGVGRPDADTVTVWVRDHGPGLDDETAAHAFDRYGTGSDPDGPDGPGLGLAVVRSVADAHQGSAWVETAPGLGARFGIDLPVRPEERP